MANWQQMRPLVMHMNLVCKQLPLNIHIRQSSHMEMMPLQGTNLEQHLLQKNPQL